MTKRFTYSLLFAALLASIGGISLGNPPDGVRKFDSQVKPLLRKYCVRCHGAKKSEAKIRIDNIDPDVVKGAHFDRWEDIREAFNSGEMPPLDQRQPSPAERDVITNWLDTEFKKAKQFGTPTHRGRVRRLTRYELQYALEDLLKISVKNEIASLPEEGTSEAGLKNNSRLLMISGPHLESYLDLIVSVTNRMKEIVAYVPYSASVDIANLEVAPPQAFTRDKRKIKPPVANVVRDGKGVVINPKGYIDLMIPSISKFMFQTFLSAKADAPSEIQVDIGFTRSDIDPRQNVAPLGPINIGKSDQFQTYSLDSFPESLPRQMTRALDRPFFIRITNKSRQKIYLESFRYKGNVNTKLTETLIPTNVVDSDVDGYAQQKINGFIEKAFRRRPGRHELEKYFGVYQRHLQNENSIKALLTAYKEILCSPSFLYIGIPGDLSQEAKKNYKLAERLASFLWCSIPDDQLLKLARNGELTTPVVLTAQVQRMLADEKSRRWVENFTDQWLQTAKLLNVAVDKNYYPRFREPHKEMMRQETIEAVNDVFRKGAPATDFLDADHVFVNQTLAALYQIKGVRGNEFRKVAVRESDHRGGLLTQGTFLVGNSDGMNSHAILRGVWLAEVMLNDPPPDPPKNVPPLDESIPGFDKMTLNEKLIAHRSNDACKNCHSKIDPWGIPFENYDASGAWRDKVLVVSKTTVETEVVAKNGKKRKRKRTSLKKSYVGINHTSTLPDDVTINGVDELKDYLMNHRKRDFAQGLVKRILAYALSRDIDYHDQDWVNELVNRFERNEHSVPNLIQNIVHSEQFQ